ncbi:putative MFS general substrate transporter [Lyophyllum shimeji]|uniref:MFS general substrate transporter n=1 Tax=Lyophyllum shimeji TaxID=47721 RepID=A0A9P3PNU2_LYOSH|nr:putative MFS general substrate transporter [Lyophyllum shimeji]
MPNSSSSTVAVPVVPELPDAHNPRKWSTLKRWYIALVIWNFIAPIDMTSTLYAGGQAQIQEEFKVSHFVVTLGVGLVNFGFAIGPLVYAPLSELYGRQPVYIATAITFAAFSLGTALAPNIEALLIFRLLAGALGAAVFSNFGGSLSDMFTPDERGPLVALFTLVLQGAPTIGPVPGSLMGQYVSWRWIMGLNAIWGAAIGLLVLFLPETEPGKIARTLKRKEEKDREDSEKAIGVSVLVPDAPRKLDLWVKSLLTPLILLFREPIVLATSLYHAFVYGLLFILLEGYPYVYQHTYSLSLAKTGLTFISPWIGNVFGVLVYFGYFKQSYVAAQQRLYAENARLPYPHPNPTLRPEARLPGVILSSLLVPIGMFWFAAASNSPHVHIIVPLLSGVPVGMGMTLLQLSLANYYIDLYPTLSASVLAANCFVRNMLATWFPTFATPMYENLGGRRASFVLAGIGCAGVPAGVILLIWGEKLRGMSKRAAKEREWDGQRGGWVDELRASESPSGTHGDEKASA